ncbi:helix-turn-helix transcriptional regulator [Nonomuraea sp. NN258]|uniref:helix-turn-helix domain-containing protein n=1 Tax=Nonomuraea antri TaxID=2730852 RepID=UPI001568D10F|nr:helix-turn-helix transcriptional regulator [Nonomuraea antri]
MVGGRARTRAPRDLADNPQAWPEADLSGHVAADAVQHVARRLSAAIDAQRISLRALATASGVNRQAIADLLAGRSWPDVATVARLGHAVGRPLWPAPGCGDCAS